MEAVAEFLLKYWPLLLFTGGMVSTWLLLKFQQVKNTEDISKMKENKEKEAILLTSIQDRLGNIETSMIYMKETMNNLNGFIQMLLKQELKK